jgi:hypothetical protein
VVAFSNPTLWKRIEGYSFDQPDAVLPFSRRLARDNGWTHEYASRVIQEYKKFIYLSCLSETIVTPSVDVDQAWHLHMVYTRDYWQRFCRQTLGKEIHHEPTEGGAAERDKFWRAYQRTISTYTDEFGQQPPSDIWPLAEVRFASAQMASRYPNDSFVIPGRLARFGACAGVIAIAGSMAFAAGVPPEVVIAIAFAGLLLSFGFFFARGKTSADGGGCGTHGGDSGCGGCGGE